MTVTDWYAWHADYDELFSAVSGRLVVVQDLVRSALDAALDARGAARVVSIAAGQSRDLLPVLIEHPRRELIRARVVELDARNVDFAEGAMLSAGFAGIEFVTGDAGLVDAFAPVAPADVVLAGELLPLLAPADALTTIAGLPQLCAPGATVVWSAGSADPAWDEAFVAAGFAVDRRDLESGVVAACVYGGPVVPLVAGARLFRLG